jgi:DNA-binding NtrC family response regulator
MEMPRLEHLREPNLRPFGEPDADDMLGESPPIWALRDRLAFVARTNKHVLVLGQSGSGKELAARAIHRQSGARGALVALNAATLPPGLIDAELFGNLKNYPNAGQPERVGLVGEADGGTLFLDEIGELSEDVQAHLFRVLDRSGEYHRLGEAKTRRSRFRLVGATNRAMSRLRPELRARIPLQVDVPSLDARKEDIPLLVRHLLRRAAEETPSLRERILAVDGEGGAALLERLLRRTYTTNVRELEGLLWEEIQRGSGPARAERGAGTAGSEAVTPVDPAESAQRGEGADVPSKEVLVAALSDADGRVALAAEKLGVDRYRVYRWMRLYGMR